MKAGIPALVSSLSIIAAACTQQSPPPDVNEALGAGQVATVDGEPIPESVFRLYAMTRMNKDADQLTPDERQAVIEDLVGFKVLAEEAEERGLLAERRVAAELELQRWQLIARASALRYLEENPATDAELQELYDENLPRLAATQYKARHILVETRDEAAAVIAELDAGKDFVAAAEERASGPTGPNGGDLGWLTEESFVQTFGEGVRTMNVGSYSSEPIQTDFGFHILLLEDTRAQDPPALDAIRTELANAVDRRKIDAYVKSLRDQAAVEIESQLQ
jgi:peptidyl-prolyl cis-trans isomerase C